MSNHLKYLSDEIDSMDDHTSYMVISDELKIYGKTLKGYEWKRLKFESNNFNEVKQ